jgi:hypothetical protein
MSNERKNAGLRSLEKLDTAEFEKVRIPTEEEIRRALDEGHQAAVEFERTARQQARIDPRIRFVRS